MRTHPEPTGYSVPPQRPITPQSHYNPRVLLAVGDASRNDYAGALSHVVPSFPANTADAVQAIANDRARLVVVDLDEPAIDGIEVCRAAKAARARVLVTTDAVARVPAAIKAGCDGVLLKPFQRNLLAARVGRMLRNDGTTGTNREWPDTACPTCGHLGATSFDFASYRRMWYACLACDATWIGRRQE